MKRRGNMKTRKKLVRLFAVLVASSMVLGSPNAVAFAEGNEVSQESLSGNSPVEKASATLTEEKEVQKTPVSEETSGEEKAEPEKKVEVSEKEKTDTEQVEAGESEAEKAPEEQEKSEAVQAFLTALDQIMELQENDAEAEEVLAAVEETKKLYEALSEEEKGLEEVKAGYGAIESFESVNPLEEVQDGTEEHPWLVSDYDKLKNAINCGGYIQLEKDVYVNDYSIYVRKSVVMDLNNYNLSFRKGCIDIANEDLTVIGNGGSIVGEEGVFEVKNKGKLLLQGGKYTAKVNSWVIKNVKESGSVIVDGGAELTGGFGARIREGGSVTVKNGTVTGRKDMQATIMVENASVTVEKDGIIKSEKATGIWAKGGSTVSVFGKVESEGVYGIHAYGSDKKNILNIYPGSKISSLSKEALNLENANDEVNITGGDITGASGIVISNGTLNVSGNKTKITGAIQDNVNVSDFSGAGIMICGKDYNQKIKVSVTVEDAEITGACAVYGKGGLDVTWSEDMEVNLVGGKYTSTATKKTDKTKNYPLKAAVKFEERKFGTGCLAIKGGKYSGEAENSAYPEYYGEYFDDKTYKLTEVLENGETYYEIAKIPTNDAEVDGVTYPTLQGAINAAKEGSTVKLLNDLTESVTVSKAVVLNLNGKTLTNEDGKHTITVSEDGILTVEDGTGNGAVDNVSDGKAALYNEGTVTLNGGIFDRSKEAGKVTNSKTYATEGGGNSWYTIANVSGTMTINDGVVVRQAGGAHDDAYGYKGFHSSLVCNKYSRLIKENIVTDYTKGTMTINGGEFYGGKMNVKNEQESTLTIHGGHFHENLGYSVYNYGDAEITGGTFVSWNNTVIGNAGSSCSISGGTFNAVNKDGKETRATTDNASGKKTIVTGGTFSNKYIDYGSNFLGDNPEYKRVNIDGAWKVVRNDNAEYLDKTDPNAVAKVGGKCYLSLENAVADIEDGDEVILLKDVKISQGINFGGKSLTLDLGGCTITGVSVKDPSTGKEKDMPVLCGSSAVHIKNGTIVAEGARCGILWNGSSASLTLEENVNVSSDSKVALQIEDGAKAVVKEGCSINSANGYAITLWDDDTALECDGKVTAKWGAIGNNAGEGQSGPNQSITIGEKAELISTGGTAICHLGEGKVFIKGGTVTGAASGIEIRSGELTVDGGKIIGGKDNFALQTPEGAKSGTTVLGAGIAVSQHVTNKPVKVVINGGTMEGEYAFYEVDLIDKQTDGISVTVNNGTFNGEVYSQNVEKFIQNGNFSTDVTAYCITGYNAVLSDGRYTIKAVQTSGGDNNGSSTDSGNSSSSGGGSHRGSGSNRSNRDEILNAGGASPMLIPVPQQTAVQEPVAPTPSPAQPTATAPAPAPLPAEEPTRLEDESVPLAEAPQEKGKEKTEPEKVINIGDEEVPMAAPNASWAIINLFLMLLTAAGAILTVVGSIRRKEEETEVTGSSLWMVSLIPAICSAAVFVLTEKIGTSIVIADRWTVAMLLIALAEGAVVFFIYRMTNKAHDRA